MMVIPLPKGNCTLFFSPNFDIIVLQFGVNYASGMFIDLPRFQLQNIIHMFNKSNNKYLDSTKKQNKTKQKTKIKKTNKQTNKQKTKESKIKKYI